MCRVNPRVDFAFRKLFGSEENKDILISFINSVVSEQDQVADLELLNPYNSKNFKQDKSSVLDIKAKGQDGKLFNIEMQIIAQHNFDKRSLYFWSRMYSGQIGSGERYYDLCKTISINVLNFNFLPEEHYHNVYQILNINTHTMLTDDLEMHYIELKKYNQQFSNVLDRWVNFLQKADGYTQNNLPDQLQQIPYIKKAVDTLDYMNFTYEEREEYEAKLKFLRDVNGGLTKAHDDGLKAGFQEGIEKGLEEGIEKGMERGKKEAMKLLAIGLLDILDIETIASKTGLAIEEIISLKAKS